MANLVTNKKAGFNYELGEKMTAGVELLGLEVKALRAGLGSLEGSYIIVRGAEAFLIESFIPPYQGANTPPSYNERRNRKILLKKSEIAQIADSEKKKVSVIPLAFFSIGTKIKLDFAFGTGKKKYDKRESIKKRDTERDMRREK